LLLNYKTTVALTLIDHYMLVQPLGFSVAAVFPSAPPCTMRVLLLMEKLPLLVKQDLQLLSEG